MKFTKAQINKERKDKKHNIVIIDDIDIEGPLLDIERDIKKELKSHWKWKTHCWGDGTKFKFSEVEIVSEREYPDMYSNDSVTIYKVMVTKFLPEDDETVIKRLTANAKAKARRDNAKAIQEKKERTMLKKLKEKYKVSK